MPQLLRSETVRHDTLRFWRHVRLLPSSRSGLFPVSRDISAVTGTGYPVPVTALIVLEVLTAADHEPREGGREPHVLGPFNSLPVMTFAVNLYCGTTS